MAAQQLFRGEYPIYAILTLRKGEFVVAGGGGEAKTGVPNVLEVYKLSHNGLNYVAKTLHHHNMGTQPIMNFSCHPVQRYSLAVGIDNSCHLLSLRSDDRREEEEGEEDEEEGEEEEEEEKEKEKEEEKEEEGEEREEEGEEEEGAREEGSEDDEKTLTELENESETGGQQQSQRESGEREVTRKLAGGKEEKKAFFEVKMLASTQTDFAGSEPYQKVVRFSHNGSLLVTGGTDGIVRSWKYPTLEEDHEFKGHSNEIEDLTCHPSKPQVVSVCRSGVAMVWDLESGNRTNKFDWSPTTGSQPYRFRACCFSPANENGDAVLYTINIPKKWVRRSKQPSFLLKWDSESWKPVAIRNTGRELLSALTVDASGNLVGIGTGEGTVAIYSSDLKPLTQVSGAHSVFVTALAFVPVASRPTTKPAKPVDPVQRTPLLSVSADRSCCVITVRKQTGKLRTVLLFVILPLVLLVIATLVKILT